MRGVSLLLVNEMEWCISSPWMLVYVTNEIENCLIESPIETWEKKFFS